MSSGYAAASCGDKSRPDEHERATDDVLLSTPSNAAPTTFGLDKRLDEYPPVLLDVRNKCPG